MRARARHTHTRTPRIHARERERERMRRISRLDLLPYRSEIVLAVVAGPFLLPRGAGRGRGGPTDSRVEDRWRDGGRGGGRPYITAHEKRPSTGRLISEALPPPPFKANPRPGHESRHSTAPFYPPSLPFPSHEDEKRNLSPLDIVRYGEEEEESSTTAPRRGHLRNVEFDYL